jgi:predicted RNA-binding Zn-ribbon protein involved in translation (DUF1610 family)
MMSEAAFSCGSLATTTNGSQSMSPIRIRHLMLLVLYIAIALALSLPAIRELSLSAIKPGAYRNPWLFLATVGVLLAWACLTWFVSEAGPVRDWLTMSFASLGLTLAGPWLIVAISRSSKAWLIALLITLPWEVYLVRMITEYVIPYPCPGCLKKRLVRALKFTVDSEADLYTYSRCRECGFQGWVIRNRPFPPCPSCRQDELYEASRTGYGWTLPPPSRRLTHFWCLDCGSRWKRTGLENSLEAATPDDDRYYSLWSFPGWIRSQVERLSRVARPAR